MMVKFTHYLVTRFNVPVDNWNRDKTGHPTLDGAWMKHRLALFNRYCVPTISGQTEKNFHWVIYCDIHTFTADKQRIEESVKMIPGAEIRLVQDHGEMLSDLRKLISNQLTPYVITSRLDNDDGLGKNYIKNVQDHFKEADKLLLNPSGGIVYDVNEKVMTQMKKSLQNHYTCLVEKNNGNGKLLTVLSFPHDHPPSDVVIENIPGERAWLKIIHEKNVKSKLKGKPFFTRKEIYFEGISLDAFPFSFLNTMKYTLSRIRQKF